MDPLVRPEVPDFQHGVGHTVAQIVGATDLAGSYLHGFAAAAAANAHRKELELRAQQLQQASAFHSDEMDFKREELKVKDRELRDRMDAARTVSEAHSYWWRTQANTNAKKAASTLQDDADYNAQMQALQADATKRANELKLNDPKFQTENPIEFAANLEKFRGEYGQAPTNTGIPARVTDWQRTADQQKIPLKFGAEFDASQDKWTGGSEKTVPIWQVVRDFQNPDTHERTVKALKASGHITEETYKTPGKPESLLWWQKRLNEMGATNYAPKPGKASFEQTDDFISTWLKKGEKADFTPSPSRMPSFVPRGGRREMIKSGQDVYPGGPGSPEAGMSGMPDDPATVPRAPYVNGVRGSVPQADVDQVSEAAPSYENSIPVDEPQASRGVIGTPTQTDRLLEHARNAIAKGAPMQDVARKLQEMGIEPSQLWAS